MTNRQTPSMPLMQPMQQPVQSFIAQSQGTPLQIQQFSNQGQTPALTSPSHYAPSASGNSVMPQPGGGTYGNNPQYTAANQPQNPVIISSITGMTNDVQMNRTQITPDSFNNETLPYESSLTQLAAGPQVQRYDNTPPQMTQQAMPSTAQPIIPSSQPTSSGTFRLWDIDSPR